MKAPFPWFGVFLLRYFRGDDTKEAHACIFGGDNRRDRRKLLVVEWMCGVAAAMGTLFMVVGLPPGSALRFLKTIGGTVDDSAGIRLDSFQGLADMTHPHEARVGFRNASRSPLLMN